MDEKCENCKRLEDNFKVLEEENKDLIAECRSIRDTLYSIWNHVLEETEQYDFND